MLCSVYWYIYFLSDILGQENILIYFSYTNNTIAKDYTMYCYNVHIKKRLADVMYTYCNVLQSIHKPVNHPCTSILLLVLKGVI